MDKPTMGIKYKLANGKRISIDVSIEVKNLLEQADRQIRSQRRQDRRHHDSAEYVDGLTDTTTVISHEDFADLIDRLDSYKQLYAAIETLSDIQKQWVYLHYFCGFTYRKIASMESVHHTTVMRTVKRAQRTLMELLQP